MSSDPITLTLMARSKMHSSTGGRDRCSLHRWVLLKNSLSVYPPQSVIHPVSNDSITTAVNQNCLAENHDRNDGSIEEAGTGHGDSFLFPDAGKLVSTSHSDRKSVV